MYVTIILLQLYLISAKFTHNHNGEHSPIRTRLKTSA